MKERALTLDYIPMVRCRIGAHHLRPSRLEVRHHGIHGHAATGDENPGLAGGTEVDRESPFGERPRESESRVFLAERTIGTDGEEPLARALEPGRNGYRLGRYPHVD